MGNGAASMRSAVVGDRCQLPGDNSVSPRVRLWPDKWLSSGTNAGSNIVWGYGEHAGFLGKAGFVGDIGTDLTPLRLGRIFGAAAEYMSGKERGTVRGSFGMERCGIATGVGHIYDERRRCICDARYGTAGLRARCGHGRTPGCVCLSGRCGSRKLAVDLFEPDISSCCPNRRVKRLRPNILRRARRWPTSTCGREIPVHAADELYESTMPGRIDRAAIKRRGITVLVRGGRDIDALVSRALTACDVHVRPLLGVGDAEITQVLRNENADFAASISKNADSIARCICRADACWIKANSRR